MSTALAIGAVSAVLRNVLDNGLIDAVPALGTSVKVSAKAPDLIKGDDPQSGPQLNLFLYRVSANAGWRNAALPSRDSTGRRISNPPLALDLHYLLTAYGREDLQAEILLGYGMQLLHERSFLDRAAIRKALELGPVDANLLPEAFQKPPHAGLADQMEMLKLTLEPLDLDGMSKIWSAVQSNYRPSAAYQVSVVLIEASYPASSPLPVLSRTAAVGPSLTVPYPTIESVSTPDGTNVAELGDTITLNGHHLAGTGITIRLGHRLVAAAYEVTIASNTDASQLSFSLPATEAGGVWPAGLWTVGVTMTPDGMASERTTNTAAFMLAPNPSAAVLTKDAATQRIQLQVDLAPQARPEQAVTLSLNGAQATVGPRTLPATQVTAEFPPMPPGPAWLRVRVDGVDSPLIDYSAAPPAFRADRKVTVP